jgi:hypothetical protein
MDAQQYRVPAGFQRGADNDDRRRKFMWIIPIAILVMLGLAIGLSLGLTNGGSGESPPTPTPHPSPHPSPSPFTAPTPAPSPSPTPSPSPAPAPFPPPPPSPSPSPTPTNAPAPSPSPSPTPGPLPVQNTYATKWIWNGPTTNPNGDPGVLVRAGGPYEIGFLDANLLTVTDVFPSGSGVPWQTLQTMTTKRCPDSSNPNVCYYSKQLKIADQTKLVGQYMKISFTFAGSNENSDGGGGTCGVSVWVGGSSNSSYVATSFGVNTNRNVQTFFLVPNSLLTTGQIITLESLRPTNVRLDGFDSISVQFTSHY